MIFSEKALIAKLLATENISVVQDNVQTASFNVRDRILTLPLWAELDEFVSNHLIGHEVGHALYTPESGWHDAVCDSGPAFKSYLNVVEDARIEKLVLRKYPGLRPDFVKSYKKLLKEGFFGTDGVEGINNMRLIDRINTYFKCGPTIGVKFNEEEAAWLPRIEALETWEEVVALTEELFDYAREQRELEKELKQEQQGSDEDENWGFEENEDGDDFGEDGDDFGQDFDSLFGEDGDTEEDGENGYPEEGDEESGDFPFSNGAGKSDRDHDELASETDSKLRDGIDSLSPAFDGDIWNLKLPKMTFSEASDYIVGYKDVIADISNEKFINPDEQERYDNIVLTGLRGYGPPKEGGWRYGGRGVFDAESIATADAIYASWYKDNKKAVSHMVKDFEMKKSASYYARASLAKTGVIDTIKMNNYKTSDDIFKKVTVVPDGKNHGFVMVLDLSGSMSCTFYDAAKAVVLMAQFCRQISVPFRVYGFTDYVRENSKDETSNDWELMIDRDLVLLELFNESMSIKDFKFMAGHLLYSAHTHQFYYKMGKGKTYNQRIVDIYENVGRKYAGLTCKPYYAKVFSLGGTPLDDSIQALIPVVNEFRKAHRLDVMNTIFMTDGCSNGHSFATSNDNGYLCKEQTRNAYPRGRRKLLATVTNEYTKETIRYSRAAQGAIPTNVMLRMFKQATGSNVLGYFVVPHGGAAHFAREFYWLAGGSAEIETHDPDWRKKCNRGEHVSVPSYGYDELYLLSGKALNRDVKDNMSSLGPERNISKIKSAFRKNAANSVISRRLLSHIIETVA